MTALEPTLFQLNAANLKSGWSATEPESMAPRSFHTSAVIDVSSFARLRSTIADIARRRALSISTPVAQPKVVQQNCTLTLRPPASGKLLQVLQSQLEAERL